ncbi:MAG TPA: hypothetical protein VGH46_02580 [Gaiellaceae bacterium]|jgi:hypothetical protein
MDVERLADGLWRWTTAASGSVYYEAPDAVVLFDPLLPAGEEEKFLAYLDRDVERLGLPVSILLTAPRHERSAPILRERYRADDRVPDTVEVHSVADGVAYFISPHRALVIPALDDFPVASANLPVEFVLPSELAG